MRVDSSTIYVAFADHYVGVSSASDAALSSIAYNFEPMLSIRPAALAAGDFYIDSIGSGYSVEETHTGWQAACSDVDAVARTLRREIIKRFIEMRPELVWMHAGAVGIDGQALLLVAPSGGGKSTLVSELLARGCSYLSDEVIALDLSDLRALPFPVRPWRREANHPRLAPERLHEIPKIPVRLSHDMVAATPLRLAHVYFLHHNNSRAVTSHRCSPSLSVLEMSRNSFHLQGARTFELNGLCRIASAVQSSHLQYAHASEAAAAIVTSHCLTAVAAAG